MGLQTCVGIQVWVRWVWVWVKFKVPDQNPYLTSFKLLTTFILHKQSHVNTINNGDSDVCQLLPFYPILSPPPLDYLYWTTFT